MPPRVPKRRNGKFRPRIGPKVASRDAPCRASAPHGQKGPVKLEQQLLGGLPVYARIGDGQAVLELAQVLRDGLTPRFQVTLEHESDNGAVAVHYLGDTVFCNERLQTGVLVG